MAKPHDAEVTGATMNAVVLLLALQKSLADSNCSLAAGKDQAKIPLLQQDSQQDGVGQVLSPAHGTQFEPPCFGGTGFRLEPYVPLPDITSKDSLANRDLVFGRSAAKDDDERSDSTAASTPSSASHRLGATARPVEEDLLKLGWVKKTDNLIPEVLKEAKGWGWCTRLEKNEVMAQVAATKPCGRLSSFLLTQAGDCYTRPKRARDILLTEAEFFQTGDLVRVTLDLSKPRAPRTDTVDLV